MSACISKSSLSLGDNRCVPQSESTEAWCPAVHSPTSPHTDIGYWASFHFLHLLCKTGASVVWGTFPQHLITPVNPHQMCFFPVYRIFFLPRESHKLCFAYTFQTFLQDIIFTLSMARLSQCVIGSLCSRSTFFIIYFNQLLIFLIWKSLRCFNTNLRQIEKLLENFASRLMRHFLHDLIVFKK